MFAGQPAASNVRRAAGSASNTQTGGSGWTEVHVPGTSSSSGTLTISATNTGSSGNVYWDDFSITGGVGAAGGQEFAYDGFGNLLSQQPVFGTAPMMTLAVNPNTNQVTSSNATYDAAGNLTYDGTTNYSFDEMNRMTQASGTYGIVGYSYSPGENKRMVVYGSSSNPQTLKMFLYAPNGKLLSQLAYQKNGSAWAPIATNALTNYLYLGSKALSYAESSVGSNASGTYWPYGSTNTNPTTGPSTFGTYLGDFSGLDYADQRYYDYNWGRFLTTDPSDKNIDRANSVTWNRYAYVNGDPANGSDSHGLDLQICPASGENGGVCYTIPDGSTENDVFNITTDSDGNVVVTNVTNVESVTVVGVPDPQEYTFTYDLNGNPLDQTGNPDTALILNPTSIRLSWPLGSRTTYAGPGSGQDLPNGQSDAYAQTHDLCSQNARVTALTTALNVLLFRAPSAAQQACDAQL